MRASCGTPKSSQRASGYPVSTAIKQSKIVTALGGRHTRTRRFLRREMLRDFMLYVATCVRVASQESSLSGRGNCNPGAKRRATRHKQQMQHVEQFDASMRLCSAVK